jgi:hypothetical protein
MTVEFAQEVIESRSWRIKGVGMYGSDVNVVALDEYQDLVHAYKSTLETLTRWAKSAIAYEKALRVAADDLDKAANQFAGLVPDGRNADIFAEKAERARAPLSGQSS